jgi:hypothetical protein
MLNNETYEDGVFEGISIEKWEREFASQLYKNFVDYELWAFGQRVMPEEEIYKIAFDLAIEKVVFHKQLCPKETADKTFESLKK